MTDTIELEKVIIAGEVQYMTHDEMVKLEEQYKQKCYLFPHTEKSRKEYEKA